MKVLFTCGGTAGHINPAVALARLFQQRNPSCQVLFVGAEGGMECRLVPKEGYELRTVCVSSIWRGLSPADIQHNLKSLKNIIRSKGEAAAILNAFKPDLVVGTGGYASYPVVREAARRGIPTAVHESNAVPGLTTKMLSKVVNKVMVGFEESRAYYPHPERVVVTGTPVRGDFFAYTQKEARAKLGLMDERPLVLTYWGSLGAEVMNDYTAKLIERERDAGCPFRHIHGAGRNYKAMTERLGRLPADIEIREYIYDMPLVMSAADLVVCRAGASTIAELTAIAKPSILVPSPNVTNNHQEKNARVLEGHGAAVLLPESACSGERLYTEVGALLSSTEHLVTMSKALAALSTGDAAEEIYTALLGLLRP